MNYNYGCCLPGPPTELKIMAHYPKIKKMGSIVSVILTILEVQVPEFPGLLLRSLSEDTISQKPYYLVYMHILVAHIWVLGPSGT